MMGLPKRSQMMMVMKTLKPRPMYSADPQGRACGAPILGHTAKGPDSGRSAQAPLPPAQFLKPDSMSLIPMRATVGPVTRGGKRRFRSLGLMNERPISSKAQSVPVPIRAP